MEYRAVSYSLIVSCSSQDTFARNCRRRLPPVKEGEHRRDVNRLGILARPNRVAQELYIFRVVR